MTRRWQREIDNADAAERAAAIRRSDYYDGDAIAWMADVNTPEPFANTCECGSWKAEYDAVCTDCNDKANGEPNG